MTSVLSQADATLAVDAVTPRLSGGLLEVYDESQLLVQMRLSRPAFDDAVSGTAIARPIGVGRVVAGGLARRFVLTDADGVTVISGTVGNDPDLADLALSQRALQPGAEVRITSGRYIQEVL